MPKLFVIFSAIAAAWMGWSGTSESIAPNREIGILSPAGPMLLSAASPEFLACKDKCYAQYKCEAMPTVMNKARAECGEKRKACVKACPK